uniref:Uncharacterized protein TCIL3000_10_13860 n=1 Tax=Trypanosoma congolense (strain IL3000) TaxID=1068625 RepID=G0UYY3_TRYCI|nr:unnamed protein product [Trypanosoma congolense IL3000]
MEVGKNNVKPLLLHSIIVLLVVLTGDLFIQPLFFFFLSSAVFLVASCWIQRLAMLSSGKKGPGFRPQLRVCYLCGQQFGNASIGIHIPQCYSKKLAQWEVGDPATRGNRPKHPDTVNWKGSGISTERLMDEQFQEFTNNLVPCDRCGRRFLPDRLPVHLRGCKGDGRCGSRGNTSNDNRGSVGSSRGLGPSGTQGGRSPSSSRGGPQEMKTKRLGSVGPGAKPQLPICYLCGQQFGTSSIGIHVPQCYAKKLGQWEVADVATRGKPPRHPDSFDWKGSGGGNIEEHNDAQFAEFVRNLEPCPNCGRKFLADRLVVHLRSCKPGSTSKPPPPPGGISSCRPSTGCPPSANTTGSIGKNKKGVEPVLSGNTVPGALKYDKGLPNINPKVKRLPKDGKIDAGGKECPRCRVVEYDSNAKYCRECGANMACRNLENPCAHCGEAIPEGSRFCGTCGAPINGAAADERGEGAENINAPTVRVVPCPACKAICDADSNFCDNCGGVLGDTEPTSNSVKSSPSKVTRKVMYCKACGEVVEELSAKYCEECGEALEERDADMVDKDPPAAESTLTPREVRNVITSQCTTPKTRDTLRPIASPSTAGSAGRPRSSLMRRNNEMPVARREASRERENPHLPAVTSRSRSPSSAERAVPLPTAGVEYEAGDDVERLECGRCGRRFAPDVLQRHERVCASQKPRKVFNMRAQRLAGTGAQGVVKKSGGSADAVAPPKKNWRAESEAFRRSLREARMVDKVLKSGGNVRDLPAPTYSENSHYTPCPHCGRKFAPDVAERHIPRCANTVNKPKAPPRRRL